MDLLRVSGIVIVLALQRPTRAVCLLLCGVAHRTQSVSDSAICCGAPSAIRQATSIAERLCAPVVAQALCTCCCCMSSRLQVARILSAEPLANSEKLLKMRADLGGGDIRQIMAGTVVGSPQQMHLTMVISAYKNTLSDQVQIV